MANLINLEPVEAEAPLASGDEMTPSLEYTLDEPPPPPGGGEDDTERDQTPSSGGGAGSTVFDDPPPPPMDDIMQPVPAAYDPPDDEESEEPPTENPPEEEPKQQQEEEEVVQEEEEERLDLTPAMPLQPTPADMEPAPEEYKPAAIVMPTQMMHPTNPGGDQGGRQPIYEEVNEKHPQHHNNPGDEQTPQDTQHHNDPEDEHPDHTDTDGGRDEKADLNEKEKEAAQAGDTKPAEEGKEAEEGSVGERTELRLTPPDAPMPKHRSRCVACGCPRVCCARNFVFLWVVLFILLQAGPLAVLILDLLGMNTHGTTISRFVSEWGMKPAVCRVSKLDSVDFNNNCTSRALKEYKCLEVEVKLYRYEKTGPFANDVPLWRSEREYVLNASQPRQPHCFNLDVCSIAPKQKWYEYRNLTQKDEKILENRISYTQEGFVCYYKERGEFDYLAFKEKNTSIWAVLLWFFLPLAGILICWIIVFSCICWYCCPRPRTAADPAGRKHNGGYQEVENVDEASGDHDPANNSKEQLVLEEAGAATQV